MKLFEFFKQSVREMFARFHSSELEKSLVRLLGKAKLEQLKLTTPDRRTWLERAALLLSVGEEELLSKLAKDLGRPLILRLRTPNLNVLTREFELEHLMAIGVVPIYEGNLRQGFACVDPLMVVKAFPALANDGVICLAPWREIRHALSELLRQRKENHVRHVAETKEQQGFICQKILEKVVALCSDNELENFKVDFGDEQPIYILEFDDGRIGQGQISNHLRSAFEDLLNLNGGEVHVLDSELQNAVVKYEWKGSVVEFSLSNRLTNIIEEEQVDDLEEEDLCSATLEIARPKNEKPLAVRPLILLIDDNVTFLRVLEKFFERKGYRTITAHNGKEALGVLEEEYPDLIICDLHMPNMNGFSLMDNLKGDVRYDDIPVIMLTSDNDIEVELQLLEKGASVFIAKNSDPRLLGLHVDRLLGRMGLKAAA